MAFISYNMSSGGGHEHEVKEGHYGLSVEQYLYDESSNSFISAVATMTSLSADQVRKYMRHHAPFDTSYQDMIDLSEDVYAWWLARRPNFLKIKSLLEKEYDPLDNYHVTHTGTVNKRNGQIEDVGSRNTSNGDTETENQIAPYDSETYHKESKSKTTYSEDVDTGNTRTYTNLEDTVNDEKKGNISMLITPQALAEEEIKLRLRFNLMDIVTKEFIRIFCIALYN